MEEDQLDIARHGLRSVQDDSNILDMTLVLLCSCFVFVACSECNDYLSE